MDQLKTLKTVQKLKKQLFSFDQNNKSNKGSSVVSYQDRNSKGGVVIDDFDSDYTFQKKHSKQESSYAMQSETSVREAVPYINNTENLFLKASY